MERLCDIFSLKITPIFKHNNQKQVLTWIRAYSRCLEAWKCQYNANSICFFCGAPLCFPCDWSLPASSPWRCNHPLGSSSLLGVQAAHELSQYSCLSDFLAALSTDRLIFLTGFLLFLHHCSLCLQDSWDSPPPTPTLTYMFIDGDANQPV